MHAISQQSYAGNIGRLRTDADGLQPEKVVHALNIPQDSYKTQLLAHFKAIRGLEKAYGPIIPRENSKQLICNFVGYRSHFNSF
ncbi:hypothetical protein [Leeuwenhoekiella aestuarii]|uniref:hypothetical protein n=1 Tax=Leeuwenhoekiella aestuarii TaxID=2249426 RepID=UPI000FFE99FA|nr:hypothetical protein [Leeuwenhoekiella aestuarii]